MQKQKHNIECVSHLPGNTQKSMLHAAAALHLLLPGLLVVHVLPVLVTCKLSVLLVLIQLRFFCVHLCSVSGCACHIACA